MRPVVEERLLQSQRALLGGVDLRHVLSSFDYSLPTYRTTRLFDHPLEYSEGNEGRENGHPRGSSREELCRFPYVDFGEFHFQALR